MAIPRAMTAAAAGVFDLVAAKVAWSSRLGGPASTSCRGRWQFLMPQVSRFGQLMFLQAPQTQESAIEMPGLLVLLLLLLLRLLLLAPGGGGPPSTSTRGLPQLLLLL